MKESRYNYFIESEGKVLCFNSNTDSYLIISNNSYNTLQNNEIDTFASKYTKTYQQMVVNGFIIDDNLDELAQIRAENRIDLLSTGEYNLTILTTQDCNLKCWYCYEGHIKDSKITPVVIDSIEKLIYERASSGECKLVNITFFGGEPLMVFDEGVLPILKYTKDICDKFNVRFSPFFVTNASLIDEKMIKKLEPYNARFQITLDGGEKRHNKIRAPKVGDKGTYRPIIDAIHLICKHIEPIDIAPNVITLRINYDDKTLGDITEIVTDLKDVDKTKIIFHLQRVWQTIGKKSDEQKEKLKNALRVIASNGFRVDWSYFKSKRTTCVFDKHNSAVLNWNGDAYRCTSRDFNKENSCGLLQNSGSIKWDANRDFKNLTISNFENKQCLNCKILPQCMGPCHQSHFENKKNSIADICTLKSAEISLKDYIYTNFELKMIAQQAQVQNQAQNKVANAQ